MVKVKTLVKVIALLLALGFINQDIASAGRGRRGGGASRRANSSVNMQNRGNFSGGQRSTNRSGNIESRQSTRQNRQDNRGNYSQNRQGERTERTDIRQGERSDRQNNRQDFIDDNYYGRGWYGGGYYSPPGWGAWGAAAFATGIVVGAVVNSPPPYYDTVNVGSTTYIYSDGVFMESSGGSYTVVNPPVGAVVNYLPEGCTQTGSYFDCGGIYYQPFYQGSTNVYKVVQL